MELREVRSLVALAELGSITRTADKLHLSAAAIHKQLKQLESELGVQQYEKRGGQLRVTSAAEVLLPHARNLLAEYDTAIRALATWREVKRGLVRIGTEAPFGTYALPALLAGFRRRHPHVELSIETGRMSPLADSVHRGTLDAAFLLASDGLGRPSSAAEATWEFEMRLVDGRPQPAQPSRVMDLREQPFILYTPGSSFGGLIDRYFAQMNFHPRVDTRFDSTEGIKAMVRSGLGLSMLPRWTIETELTNGSLFLINQQEPRLLAQIVLVTRPFVHAPQPVRAFIEMARAWTWEPARSTTGGQRSPLD